MYDLNLPHKEYEISDKKIIWFWDDGMKAGEFLTNNLFVCDSSFHELWNMKDVRGVDDVCVGLSLRENSFYFCTFWGIGIEVDIHTLNIAHKIQTK